MVVREAVFRLPDALRPENEQDAIDLLTGYFDHEAFYSGRGFSGGFFDTWDPTGTRAASVDVFTPDDLQAVAFLSTEIAPRAAIDLLHRCSSEFSDLLSRVDPDLDLVDVTEDMGEAWPATRLYRRLRQLPDVGPTRASKLLARKRPRLVPIYDTVVDAHVLGGSGVLWEPLRLALHRDDHSLHRHLLRLRDAAGLPHAVSPLRVFDVVAWHEGMAQRSPTARGATDDK